MPSNQSFGRRHRGAQDASAWVTSLLMLANSWSIFVPGPVALVASVVDATPCPLLLYVPWL